MPSEWATTTRVSGPIAWRIALADGVTQRRLVEVAPELLDRAVHLLLPDEGGHAGEGVGSADPRGGVEDAGAGGQGVELVGGRLVAGVEAEQVAVEARS